MKYQSYADLSTSLTLSLIPMYEPPPFPFQTLTLQPLIPHFFH